MNEAMGIAHGGDTPTETAVKGREGGIGGGGGGLGPCCGNKEQLHLELGFLIQHQTFIVVLVNNKRQPQYMPEGKEARQHKG